MLSSSQGLADNAVSVATLGSTVAQSPLPSSPTRAAGVTPNDLAGGATTSMVGGDSSPRHRRQRSDTQQLSRLGRAIGTTTGREEDAGSGTTALASPHRSIDGRGAVSGGNTTAVIPARLSQYGSGGVKPGAPTSMLPHASSGGILSVGGGGDGAIHAALAAAGHHVGDHGTEAAAPSTSQEAALTTLSSRSAVSATGVPTGSGVKAVKTVAESTEVVLDFGATPSSPSFSVVRSKHSLLVINPTQPTSDASRLRANASQSSGGGMATSSRDPSKEVPASAIGEIGATTIEEARQMAATTTLPVEAKWELSKQAGSSGTRGGREWQSRIVGGLSLATTSRGMLGSDGGDGGASSFGNRTGREDSSLAVSATFSLIQVQRMTSKSFKMLFHQCCTACIK